MGLLDLASFQKVAEDKKMTTLRHKDGHEIKILHSALPKIKQEQLKHLKMAKGGDVKLDHMEKGVHHQSAIKENGQSISGIDVRDGKLKEAKKTHKNKLQELKDMPNPKIKGLADGGDVGQSQDDSSADHTTNVIVNPAPGSQPMQSAQASPVAVPNSQDLPNPQLPNGSMSAPGVAQNAQIYNKLTQDIATQKAKADVDSSQQKLQEETRLRDQQQKYAQDLQNHTDDFSKYIQANPVNPRAYQESLGSGQKVATAIGLFLGGINQARGGGNPAMDFLNHQIDRDIAAQQKRTDNQRTVWGAYNDLYGNQTVANNLAKKSMNDIYTNQINLTAAQLGTPQAKANAALWNATKGPENNKLILDSAGNLSALPNNPGGPGIGPQAQNMPAQGGANQVSNNVPGQSSLSKAFMPQGEAAIPKGAAPKEDYYDSHILSPTAVQDFKSLAYTPKAKDDLPAIQAQYNQATQAEKGLGSIHDTFAKLSDEAAKTGELGNIRRNFGHEMDKLPLGVGHVLSAPVNYATDTEGNRSYAADQSALLGYISSALKGTNIGAGQIQDIVNVNSPEYGDSPAVIAKKERNIKDFIMNHTDTSLLKTWGLSKK